MQQQENMERKWQEEDKALTAQMAEALKALTDRFAQETSALLETQRKRRLEDMERSTGPMKKFCDLIEIYEEKDELEKRLRLAVNELRVAIHDAPAPPAPPPAPSAPGELYTGVPQSSSK